MGCPSRGCRDWTGRWKAPGGAGSIVDEVEPQIRELSRQLPAMPATVIAERIGWTWSLTVVTKQVRELRQLFLAPDPAQRTEYVAGELANPPRQASGGTRHTLATFGL